MDGVKMEYKGHSLTWIAAHSHMLISLMEQNWKYEELIPRLTEEWEEESYDDLQLLKNVAPPEVVRFMHMVVSAYIIEKILDFRRSMVGE